MGAGVGQRLQAAVADQPLVDAAEPAAVGRVDRETPSAAASRFHRSAGRDHEHRRARSGSAHRRRSPVRITRREPELSHVLALLLRPRQNECVHVLELAQMLERHREERVRFAGDRATRRAGVAERRARARDRRRKRSSSDASGSKVREVVTPSLQGRDTGGGFGGFAPVLAGSRFRRDRVRERRPSSPARTAELIAASVAKLRSRNVVVLGIPSRPRRQTSARASRARERDVEASTLRESAQRAEPVASILPRPSGSASGRRAFPDHLRREAVPAPAAAGSAHSRAP